MRKIGIAFRYLKKCYSIGNSFLYIIKSMTPYFGVWLLTAFKPYLCFLYSHLDKLIKKKGQLFPPWAQGGCLNHTDPGQHTEPSSPPQPPLTTIKTSSQYLFPTLSSHFWSHPSHHRKPHYVNNKPFHILLRCAWHLQSRHLNQILSGWSILPLVWELPKHYNSKSKHLAGIKK